MHGLDASGNPNTTFVVNLLLNGIFFAILNNREGRHTILMKMFVYSKHKKKIFLYNT